MKKILFLTTLLILSSGQLKAMEEEFEQITVDPEAIAALGFDVEELNIEGLMEKLQSVEDIQEGTFKTININPQEAKLLLDALENKLQETEPEKAKPRRRSPTEKSPMRERLRKIFPKDPDIEKKTR